MSAPINMAGPPPEADPIIKYVEKPVPKQEADRMVLDRNDERLVEIKPDRERGFPYDTSVDLGRSFKHDCDLPGTGHHATTEDPTIGAPMAGSPAVHSHAQAGADATTYPSGTPGMSPGLAGLNGGVQQMGGLQRPSVTTAPVAILPGQALAGTNTTGMSQSPAALGKAEELRRHEVSVTGDAHTGTSVNRYDQNPAHAAASQEQGEPKNLLQKIKDKVSHNKA